MENRKIRIGMGQLLVEGGEPERNLNRAVDMIEKAVSKRCDIVLLPECLDLAWTHPSARKEACPVPGPYSDILCQQAKKHRVHVCAGLTEKDKDKVYNTAVFIDSSGAIILKYRKINLLVVEQEYYAAGRSIAVVETSFGLIGVNICADNYKDGLVIGHALARMGAQIILSPSSWTVDYSFVEMDDPYGEKWIRPYYTLAKFYHLAIVGTTSVGVIVGGPYEGKKMVGCSLAIGPEGIMARGRYNEFAGELIVAEFDVPERPEKGTAIGVSLESRGYDFNANLLNLKSDDSRTIKR